MFKIGLLQTLTSEKWIWWLGNSDICIVRTSTFPTFKVH